MLYTPETQDGYVPFKLPYVKGILEEIPFPNTHFSAPILDHITKSSDVEFL